MQLNLATVEIQFDLLKSHSLHAPSRPTEIIFFPRSTILISLIPKLMNSIFKNVSIIKYLVRTYHLCDQ